MVFLHMYGILLEMFLRYICLLVLVNVHIGPFLTPRGKKVANYWMERNLTEKRQKVSYCCVGSNLMEKRHQVGNCWVKRNLMEKRQNSGKYVGWKEI